MSAKIVTLKFYSIHKYLPLPLEYQAYFIVFNKRILLNTPLKKNNIQNFQLENAPLN